jgi:hypothetical protein
MLVTLVGTEAGATSGALLVSFGETAAVLADIV